MAIASYLILVGFSLAPKQALVSLANQVDYWIQEWRLFWFGLVPGWLKEVASLRL